MKSIIFTILILIIVQNVYATEYPPNKNRIINELGEKYYSLRAQLPLEEGYFRSDEALIDRNKYINIILKLLSDKDVTKTRDKSLLESVNKDSSEFIFNECIFMFNALFALVDINPYQNIYEAIEDQFKMLSKENRQLVNNIIEKRYGLYSVFYQKKNNISKDCADTYAKCVFTINKKSRNLNYEAINGLSKLIEKGCVFIGVLSNYSRALLIEGKFGNTRTDSNKKVIDLYNQYFDKLSDNDLNKTSTFSFLRRISFIKNSEGDFVGEHEINKKIVTYISSNKIKLKEQPEWVRAGYLKLLSKSARSRNENYKKEIVEGLKKVLKNKGDIFMIMNGKNSTNLTDDEKQFLKLIQKN